LETATVRTDSISTDHFISLKKESHQSVESWICQTFPKTFSKMQPLPLATGIQQAAIQAMPHTLNSAELVRFLRQWTRSPAYLKALAQREAMRCDLNGNPIESVKDGVKKWAEQMLLSH
jgi:sRNA-binding protein